VKRARIRTQWPGGRLLRKKRLRKKRDSFKGIVYVPWKTVMHLNIHGGPSDIFGGGIYHTS